MIIKSEDSLSNTTVRSILVQFEMSFDEPLHDEIDFLAYSEKWCLLTYLFWHMMKQN